MGFPLLVSVDSYNPSSSFASDDEVVNVGFLSIMSYCLLNIRIMEELNAWFNKKDY